ncbi:PREDICTED: uncharacterized protein LOC109466715 isoform X1 [Branchiostoma belcheri]|uniref:Uncharacterized protein LOC109466715 isoform X1 n=1 Tax=Branchiostoma belcheri TaxID=7741 RepID=A0A6P4YMU5_BRABE|nr:PREDICTED: uncharacterized protein LOC109466715 isoform X1 [Branchiostoma belcheri]
MMKSFLGFLAIAAIFYTTEALLFESFCSTDADCEPNECCERSIVLNSCKPRPGLYEYCNIGSLTLTGLCSCDEGLECVDYNQNFVFDVFTGDSWCVPIPDVVGSGGGFQ